MNKAAHLLGYLYRYFVLVWICWSLDLVAGFCTGAAVVADRSVPLAMSGLLLANNFAVWAIVLVLPSLLGVVLQRVPLRRPWLPWVSRMVVLLAVWLVACGWLVSWILYGRTGDFLSRDWLEWVWRQFHQVLLHVLQTEEVHWYLLLVGAGIAAIVWLHWLDRLQARPTPPSARGALVLSALWFLLGATAPSIVQITDRTPAAPATTTAVASEQTRTELFWQVLQYHTSPLARLLLETMSDPATLEGSQDRAALERLLTTEAKRIIPLSAYLRTVPPQTPRYNVILIFVESLRADRLQRLGAKREVMPHLDRLAESSLVFGQAYCQSTHSDYADLCPLSSQYPLRSRRHHWYADLSYPRVLIYDILKGIGYRTAIFSSQNEEWGGMLRYLTTGSIDTLFHAATAGAPTYVPPEDEDLSERVRSGELTTGKLEDDVTVKAASRWIRQQTGQPFFLSMNLQSSHFPYHLPPHVPPTFTPSEITFPAGFLYYPPEHAPLMENRYDNSLHYIDSVLTELWQTLASTRLFDKTIVIIAGDNGEAFYEHGISTHAAHVWEEAIHVPLVIHAPQVAGGIVQTPVHILISRPPSCRCSACRRIRRFKG